LAQNSQPELVNHYSCTSYEPLATRVCANARARGWVFEKEPSPSHHSAESPADGRFGPFATATNLHASFTSPHRAETVSDFPETVSDFTRAESDSPRA